jgi:hypothetical protein
MINNLNNAQLVLSKYSSLNEEASMGISVLSAMMEYAEKVRRGSDKLPPEEWFKEILLKGKVIVWDTNRFSDTALISVLKLYHIYLTS